MVVELRPVLRALALDPEERADTRLKAIRTVEELAGNLKKGASTNVNIVNPITDLGPDDDQVLEQMERIARERGWRVGD